MSYSQQDEERVVLEYFGGRTGRFLDVGAADGVKFSNTRALAERGWRGVLVEPSPTEFMKLHALYGQNPRMELVNVALDMTEGVRTFYWSPETIVASISSKLIEVWKRDFHYHNWFIATLGVENFIRFFGPQFDFVSIDAEGISVELACKMLRCGLTPSLLCVENDPGIEDVLLWTRMRKLHSNANNTIFGR